MDVRQSPLQSDVLSFFTPATESFNSAHFHTPVPKFDIFEPVASKSKTITVKCEAKQQHPLTTPDHNSTESYTGLNGCYRLERLDSSVNPDITAKLDRMAQKLGFQVSTDKDFSDHNATSDCDDLQLVDCDLRDDIRAPSETVNSRVPTMLATQTAADSGHKRSLFATLIRRFSSRPKTTVTAAGNVNYGDEESSRTRATSADTRPRRIRRWFTKRLWRHKVSEPKEEHSEASMASAGAVLDGVFASTNGFDTSPLRKHPSQRQPKKPQNCLVSPSTHSGPSREFVSLEHLSSFAISKNDARLPQTFTPEAYPDEPATADPYTLESQSRFESPPRSTAISSGVTEKSLTPSLLQNKERAPSASLATVSFLQKHRDHSIHSIGSGFDARNLTDHGSFLSRRACGSEGNALHQSSRAPAVADSKPPSSYTPSYLNISVAAFGYSGYGRTSYSASSLHNSKQDRLKNLSLSNAPFLNSSICSGTGPINPEGNLHPTDRHRKKGALHVGISESNCSDSSPKPCLTKNGISDDALEPSVNCTQQQQKQTDPKQNDSPHTTSRPTSKLSQSPCPSPNTDVADSTFGGVRMRRTRTRSQTGNSDDQEHWHRSSLIMIAVAHASPRGRLATPCAVPDSSFISTQEDAHETAPLDLGLHTSGSLRYVNGNHEKRDLSITADGIYTPLTQSYHEPIREEPGEEHKPLVPTTPSPTLAKKATNLETVVDGNYFLRIADQIESELMIHIDRTEADLKSVQLDEESAGLLRTAVGKAKLLLSEKFVQFRSLCQQNLDWEAAEQTVNGEQPAKSDRPDLVTLVSDLDGFWAMVMLQVDDVRALFTQVDRLRANGWTPVTVNESRVNENGDKPVAGDGDGVCTTETHSEKKKLPTTARKRPSGHKSVGQTRDDTAARAKARERLASAKRELLAKKMQAIENTHARQGTCGTGVGEDAFIIV